MNVSNVGNWTRHIDTSCERKSYAGIYVRATSVLRKRQPNLTCQLVFLISCTAKRTEAPKAVDWKQQSADLTQLHQSQTINFLKRIQSTPKSRHRWSTRRRHAILEQAPSCAKMRLRQNSAAPQQRAHPQQRDMRISYSRPLSDRTPLWAVRDLLQGIDKILVMETLMLPISKFEHAFPLCRRQP